MGQVRADIRGSVQILARFSTRRDGRVVDGGGLENHCTRKGTGGSNPSPSARFRLGKPVTVREVSLAEPAPRRREGGRRVRPPGVTVGCRSSLPVGGSPSGGDSRAVTTAGSLNRAR